MYAKVSQMLDPVDNAVDSVAGACPCPNCGCGGGTALQVDRVKLELVPTGADDGPVDRVKLELVPADEELPAAEELPAEELPAGVLHPEG